MTANREKNALSRNQAALRRHHPVLLLLSLLSCSCCNCRHLQCAAEAVLFFLSSPLFPRFCLCLSLSCFLYYTGLLCMNSRAFKPPDLNTGLDHTTWQKKGGRTSVNHFMLHALCYKMEAALDKKPLLLYFPSHLSFMNTQLQSCHDCK